MLVDNELLDMTYDEFTVLSNHLFVHEIRSILSFRIEQVEQLATSSRLISIHVTDSRTLGHEEI
jgi:hypothetical protein